MAGNMLLYPSSPHQRFSTSKTGELYNSVICGKKDNKDFQISDTQNTIFTKKEFVNKNGEQISYNGYLGKEKPKNYVIHLDGEEISIDWNESDIMIV